MSKTLILFHQLFVDRNRVFYLGGGDTKSFQYDEREQSVHQSYLFAEIYVTTEYL